MVSCLQDRFEFSDRHTSDNLAEEQLKVAKEWQVISTLAVINAPADALIQEQWEVVQETYTVLEPFEQVTVEISADRYIGQLLLHHLL